MRNQRVGKISPALSHLGRRAQRSSRARSHFLQQWLAHSVLRRMSVEAKLIGPSPIAARWQPQPRDQRPFSERVYYATCWMQDFVPQAVTTRYRTPGRSSPHAPWRCWHRPTSCVAYGTLSAAGRMANLRTHTYKGTPCRFKTLNRCGRSAIRPAVGPRAKPVQPRFGGGRETFFSNTTLAPVYRTRS
jgi:hypothetical protein